MHVEQVFDTDHFMDAVSAIFDELGPAQAMFGAASELPNVSALLDAASSLVAFDMSFSTGIKVDDILSVVSGEADATGNLFFRLNDLGIFAEAIVQSANIDIYPGSAVKDGDFLLSAGLRVAAPFEGEVAADGSMVSGISFSHSLTTTTFTPHGQLRANLPLQGTATAPQSLIIMFQDENLFDTTEILVKIDFPVCPIVSIIDGLLGKLGSLELSPRNILGPVETAGLDLSDTLNDYFPNLAPFTDGILEGMCMLIAPFDLSSSAHLILFSPPLSHFFLFAMHSQKRAFPSMCGGCRDWRCRSSARGCACHDPRGRP